MGVAMVIPNNDVPRFNWVPLLNQPEKSHRTNWGLFKIDADTSYNGILNQLKPRLTNATENWAYSRIKIPLIKTIVVPLL